MVSVAHLHLESFQNIESIYVKFIKVSSRMINDGTTFNKFNMFTKFKSWFMNFG